MNRFAFYCSFALLLCLPVACQQATDTAKDLNERYRSAEGRKSIAANLGSEDRVSRMQPEKIVDSLDVQAGMTVADIGSGVGLLLPYLSKAVGTDGRVIAEDIFPDFLNSARRIAKEKGLDNVDFVLGTENSPNLPRGEVDLAISVDSYHHFNHPDQMLKGIREGLSKDGRLAIIDYYRRANAMPGGNAMDHIRIDADDVIKEVERNGFKLLSKKDHIPNSQYLLVFQRT